MFEAVGGGGGGGRWRTTITAISLILFSYTAQQLKTTEEANCTSRTEVLTPTLCSVSIVNMELYDDTSRLLVFNIRDKTLENLLPLAK